VGEWGCSFSREFALQRNNRTDEKRGKRAI
jgi:hypothetical protein